MQNKGLYIQKIKVVVSVAILTISSKVVASNVIVVTDVVLKQKIPTTDTSIIIYVLYIAHATILRIKEDPVNEDRG